MRARLLGEHGLPMIYCMESHEASIRTIPVLQHDPAKPEDVNTESEDHAGDEWRYACMSRPYTWVPERVERPKDTGYNTYSAPLAGDWVVY